MAEPSVKTISAPNNRRKNTIGAIQYFFLILRYSQNSNKMEILDMVSFID